MSILAPRDDRIQKTDTISFPNLFPPQPVDISGVSGNFDVSGDLYVNGRIFVDNGIDFGQASVLNWYQEGNTTRSFINASNTSPVDFRFIRVGKNITFTMKPFNFGTMNGGALQTALGSWVPSWAVHGQKVGVATFAIINGISLSMILIIFSGIDGVVIHKWSGGSFSFFANGDTLNITNDLCLSYSLN
jgi:hypothetical protein